MPPNHPTARTFYTVREAAAELRVNKNTLYRAIHDGAFPAVKIRSRFVVPVKAIDQLLERALETGQPVDPARIAAEHRTANELARQAPGGPDLALSSTT